MTIIHKYTEVRGKRGVIGGGKNKELGFLVSFEISRRLSCYRNTHAAVVLTDAVSAHIAS